MPPSEQQRRLRLTRVVLQTLIGVGGVYTLDYLLRGAWIAAATILSVMVVLGLALLRLQHTNQPTATWLAVGCYFVAVLGVSVSLGNLLTPPIWLLLIPLLSGTLLTARAMLAWTGISMVSLWGIGLLAPASLQTDPAFHTLHLTGMLLTTTLLVLWVLREHALSREQLESSQAELRELANQLIRPEERTRNALVTDLHEGVLQEIFALRLLLTGSSHEEIEPAVEQLDRIDSQLRSMVGALHPVIPDQDSLQDALQRLVARAPTHLGVTIHLTAPALPRLPDTTEKALFLTIRELLFNAARHAHADEIRLRVVQHVALLEVSIEDDGVGFTLSDRSSSGSGIGLKLCEERIAGAGGTMRVNSQPGQGTHITLTVPLPRPDYA